NANTMITTLELVGTKRLPDDIRVTTAQLVPLVYKVIVNGDSVLPVASANTDAEGPIPPKTTKQKLARKNKLKAKSTLMLAIPDEHLLKFHACKDANQEGLNKTYDRFQKLISKLEIHGEVISQEDANMKLLRSLPSAWNNIALIMRNKSDLDTLSMDDLYNNLKVYESEIKGQSSLSLNSQNLAFVSSDNTSSTNKTVNTSYSVSAASSKDQDSTRLYADDVMFSFFSNQSNAPKLDNEDLEQINADDLKEMDLKWQVAMLTIRVKRAPRNQGNRNRDAPIRNAPMDTSTTNAFVVQDVIDKTGLGYDGQMNESNLNDIHVNKSEVLNNVFNSRESDWDDNQINDRSSAPFIEEWESDSEDENLFKPKEVKKTVKPSLEKIEFVNARSTTVKNENKGEKPRKFSQSPRAAVLTKSGQVPVNAAKQSCHRVAASVSAARRVNTTASRPNVNNSFPTTYSYFKAHSPVRRPFNKKSAAKTNNFNEKINTAKIIKKLMVDAFGGNAKGGKIIGKGIENQMDHKVKTIRCDNGTKFKNRIMNEFYEMKGPKSLEDEVADDAGKKSTKVLRKENEVQDPAKEGRERAQRNKFESMFGQDKDANGNNTYRMLTHVSAVRSSFVSLGGSIPINAATLPNADLLTDPLMPDLEDTADLQDTRIFSGAYDDEVEDAMTNFKNLELITVVYVDDIIFGSIKKSLCTEFEGLMHKKFQMSSMGKLTFFLGLQVMQRDDGIFISQDKYAYTYYCQLKVSAAKSKFTTASDVYTLCIEQFWATAKVKNVNREAQIQALVDKKVYTLCIEQFWATAKVKNVNGEAQIQALVDKKVIITEASIRRDLRFEDEGGVDSLSNEVIFEQLTLMGSTMASEIICLAINQIFNFSKYIFDNMVTPLFATIMVQDPEDMGKDLAIQTDTYHTPIVTQPSSSPSQKKQKSRRKQRKEIEVPPPSSDIPNEERLPITSNDPLPSEAKTAQAKEIASLKKRVKKLEHKRKSRTSRLKRLRKAGSARRVESSTKASLGDQEDASKQGRMIDNIDQDVEITLVDDTHGRMNKEVYTVIKLTFERCWLIKEHNIKHGLF
nr:hypothetical protein [Tanacetum cinerariifolium]